VGKPKEEKPFNLQELKDKVKNEQKQNKQNQKEINNMNKKHIIVTIVLTLAFLTALATAFIYGVNYEKSVNNRVVSEAKSLVTITAEAKK
jgi:uncharacterized membrane protein (DUF106 family)